MELSKRERILLIMRDMILQEGMQAASMSKLSKHSGIPMGTIYSMFESKEDLINEVYVYCRGKCIPPNPDSGVTEQSSFREYMSQGLRNYITHSLENRNDFLFVEQYGFSPLIKSSIRYDPKQAKGPNTALDAIEKKQIKKLDPDLISCIMVGVVEKPLMMHIMGQLTLTEQDIEHMIQAAWDAVKYSEEPMHQIRSPETEVL